MSFTYTPGVSTSSAELDEYLAFASRTAVQAGGATLEFFRSSVSAENKLDDGRYDPVTKADQAAEQIVRQAIEKTYPSHGIFGEEFGHKPGNGLTWVIDPIDGTRAFMSGMVHWGVLVGLFNGQKPVIGVMYQPFTGELFTGNCTQASYTKGTLSQPLEVRNCTSLETAVVGSCGPQYFTTQAQHDAFARLEQAAMMTRYGGDCYLYAMLAMGHIDIVLDANMNAYDVQGLIPVIEGAGGVVTTWDGGDPSMGGTFVACGTRSLHTQVLETLGV
jgi:histidinol phosphatase-like enzyme (inositol monophosphatase family)